MLEHLVDGDWATARRNFEKLTATGLDTGGRRVGVRFGVQTLTWPGGSQISNAPTVSHGLGRTPIGVLYGRIGGLSAGSALAIPFTDAGSMDDTSFDVAAKTHDESSPAAATTASIFWVVIG